MWVTAPSAARWTEGGGRGRSGGSAASAVGLECSRVCGCATPQCECVRLPVCLCECVHLPVCLCECVRLPVCLCECGRLPVCLCMCLSVHVPGRTCLSTCLPVCSSLSFEPFICRLYVRQPISILLLNLLPPPLTPPSPLPLSLLPSPLHSPSNGGQYCLGLSRRYRTCNTHPCPDNTSYRQALCEREPPHHRYSSWEAPDLGKPPAPGMLRSVWPEGQGGSLAAGILAPPHTLGERNCQELACHGESVSGDRFPWQPTQCCSYLLVSLALVRGYLLQGFLTAYLIAWLQTTSLLNVHFSWQLLVCG